MAGESKLMTAKRHVSVICMHLRAWFVTKPNPPIRTVNHKFSCSSPVPDEDTDKYDDDLSVLQSLSRNDLSYCVSEIRPILAAAATIMFGFHFCHRQPLERTERERDVLLTAWNSHALYTPGAISNPAHTATISHNYRTRLRLFA